MKLRRTAATPNRDWERVPLSELYSVKYGKANPGGSGSVPVVGSSGVYAWTWKPLVMYPTIVIGRKGSAGQAWLIEAPSHPSDTTFYLEPQDPGRADVRFTYFALKYHRISASDDVIPSLQRREVESLLLPCPPIAEQRAIAGVLAKIQAAVEVQEKIVARFKDLKAATMVKLFREGLRGEPLKQTEIGEIPESWDVVRLDSLADLVGGGTPSKSRPEWWEGRIPWASPKDMKQPRLWDTEDHISEEALENGSRMVPPRTIFVVVRGMILAKDLPVAMAEVPMAFNQDMKAVMARDQVDPEYLLYAIASRKEALTRQIGTSAHGTRRMGTSSLQELLVPRPQKDEQRELARALRAIEQRHETASKTRDRLKAVFSSMLHLLVTGQVRVTRKTIALQALEDRMKRRPKWSGKVDEKVLEEIVRRIVEAVAPEKIILFGSAARGEMGPDSDLDLLVVKACEGPREVAALLRRKLVGVTNGLPKDILVVTPQDIEEHKDIPGMTIRAALREGKVLYAA